MNNSQFRRLLDISTTSTANNERTTNATPKRDGLVAAALGSRIRSSIPMTPRSVASSSGTDFAQQIAERNASQSATTIKKFRSVPAPKGTKLKPGYQDRTQSRTSTEEDEKAKRVKALEDMVKLGQMDMSTFEALRDEIVGGDLKDVHLVKGLDWKLLDRVRRGEDVLTGPAEVLQSKPTQKDPESISPAKDQVDVEKEFEKIEGQEIQPVKRDERPKRGEMAPPPVMVRKKRNRDDILKELKASRLVAAEKERQKPQPSLGPRFSKFGEKKEKSRIERDERGREILITVDEDGGIKKKVKRAKVGDEYINNDHVLLMPNKDVKPLGMEVIPVMPPSVEAEVSGDIFEGVGNDYNPLGGFEEDSSDGSDESDDPIREPGKAKSPSPAIENDDDTKSRESIPPDDGQSSLPKQILKSSLNYFRDLSHIEQESTTTPNSLADPTILAALRRASAIKPLSSDAAAISEEEAAKIARRRKMLEAHDRDEDDMDMGFGGSRFEDGEDGENRKVKLSVWGKEGSDEDGKGGGKGKRKRGLKKRKGDANSAAEVLKVMERRKTEAR